MVSSTCSAKGSRTGRITSNSSTARRLPATPPSLIATFELKNSLTKQTVEDAVEQYKRDRDPREKLFEFGRSVAHFAVDDHEVQFCTHLKGKTSWFLPFNQGWNDGAAAAHLRL